MKAEIIRIYGKNGTNGQLSVDDKIVCSTIELPWKDNDNGVSCIPEGIYELKKRFSEKHGNHLIIIGVQNRELILFHPANNAMQELRGCIAPVTRLTGEGKGIQSLVAFTKFRILTYTAFENQEKVFLTIKS